MRSDSGSARKGRNKISDAFSAHRKIGRGHYNSFLMTPKPSSPASPAPVASAGASSKISGPITLAIDIGGSGSRPCCSIQRQSRQRAPARRHARCAQSTAVLAGLEELRKLLPKFDRVSVGFPGVIKKGVTWTAANLNPEWLGFPLAAELEKRWKKPARVANDAAVQGYGAIKGVGVELALTLGTGLGSSLFTDGHLCPGLELGHHPWRKKGRATRITLAVADSTSSARNSGTSSSGRHRPNLRHIQLGLSLSRRRQHQKD